MALEALMEITEGDRGVIRQMIERDYAQAVLSGDLDKAASIYTEDAVVMAPGAPARRGRTELLEWLRTAPKPLSLAERVGHIEGCGHLAIGHGSFEMTVASETGPITLTGNVLSSFRRQADGRWLCSAVCFNQVLRLDREK